MTHVLQRGGLAALSVAIIAAGGALATSASTPARPGTSVPSADPRPPSAVADGVADRAALLGPVFEAPPDGETRLFEEAAAAAWAFLTRHRSRETGLVSATDAYDHITTWDVAGVLAAVHAAGELGLMPRDEAEAWLGTVLETLAEVELYQGVALNKSYHAGNGRMIGPGDRPSATGTGWSAIDLGRVLLWLRIVAEEHPSLAAAAERVVARFDFDRLVADGYLQGETAGPRGVSTYPEGKVGYEQYAARGFALWGHRAPKALDLHANTEPVEVLGQPILRDVRGGEKLTSEPFVLMGMELGWTPPFRELAWRVLAVQEARWRETGTLTMVSEDALPEPPHYFYYYSIFSDDEAFVVRAHGPAGADPPRWVSAKAAFAWHALLPTEYTWRVLEAVGPARTDAGWASGVYEGSGKSTTVRNLNTAAVILEAALYRRTGRPFLSEPPTSR